MKDRKPTGALAEQVGGTHYPKNTIQAVEFAQSNNMGFCEGSVVKYITRYKAKGGKSDLLKARHYIDLLIQLEYPEAPQAEDLTVFDGLVDGDEFYVFDRTPSNHRRVRGREVLSPSGKRAGLVHAAVYAQQFCGYTKKVPR